MLNDAKLDSMVKEDWTVERLQSTLVNTSMPPKSTLAHLAAYHGHNLALLTLAESGASPLAIDDIGNTPLHMAVYMKKEDTVRLLLSIHAHDAANDLGSTPLHLAVMSGQPGTCRELLLKGAKRTTTDS